MRLLTAILIVTPLMGTIPDSEDYKCPDIVRAAVSAGWEEPDWATVDRIAWAESRCQPDVIGTGAYGAMQIQWNAHESWIADMGFTRNDLFDPVVNLRVALVLAHYSLIGYGCKFQPWYMSGDWC